MGTFASTIGLSLRFLVIFPCIWARFALYGPFCHQGGNVLSLPARFALNLGLLFPFRAVFALTLGLVLPIRGFLGAREGRAQPVAAVRGGILYAPVSPWVLVVVGVLLLLVTVVQAMTKTVLGAQLRSRQRLRCGEGGAFPGGPAPAWAHFSFPATSAAKMGMLLPFMAISAANTGMVVLLGLFLL